MDQVWLVIIGRLCFYLGFKGMKICIIAGFYLFIYLPDLELAMACNARLIFNCLQLHCPDGITITSICQQSDNSILFQLQV